MVVESMDREIRLLNGSGISCAFDRHTRELRIRIKRMVFDLESMEIPLGNATYGFTTQGLAKTYPSGSFLKES